MCVWGGGGGILANPNVPSDKTKRKKIPILEGGASAGKSVNFDSFSEIGYRLP